MTSRTGLVASPTKKIYKREQLATVQLGALARPAPFILKPFAGLYNPYPFGCSLLCNHPTDNDAKELLKKAKNTWAIDGRNVLLVDEVEAIRASLEQLQPHKNPREQIKSIDSVPEELFRRYTETDSRPLTPAPTLASAATRASGSRRCVTPDPLHTSQIREKTLLVLDLRRSHSQETFSWHGSSSMHEPPLIRIQRVATRAGSLDEGCDKSHLLSSRTVSRSPTPSPKKLAKKTPEEIDAVCETKVSDEEDGDDDEFIKRRGKKRRKKRDSSRGPSTFQTPVDPETQMATIGPDSHNPSARPSLVPAASDEVLDTSQPKTSARPSKCWEIDSFLDADILKQMRRELTEEIVDNEFDDKRRVALREALKTIPKDKTISAALDGVRSELKVSPVNTELWLSLPRVFTRSSARFELPLDGRSLETLSPLRYVQSYVSVSSPRKLLYNCIFNKFKANDEAEATVDRIIAGKDIQAALNLMMGRAMTDKQRLYFRGLLNWQDEDVLDFKTFCGLCALCERLLAPEYCARLPDRNNDPCHEIEAADFEALTRKLRGKHVDPKLVEVLDGIKSR